MFTVCKQGEFLKMVSEIQEALPDSVSAWEMYVRLQPLVVRIGDGTHLCLVIINTPGNHPTPPLSVEGGQPASAKGLALSS